MPYKNKRSPKAIASTRAATKRWDKANPDRVAARHRRSYLIHQTIIRAAKDRPCADCGVKYPPWVMQFDHVRGVKMFVVSDAYGPKSVRDEIRKCDVVCANCHAHRTYIRKIQLQALVEAGEATAPVRPQATLDFREDGP